MCARLEEAHTKPTYTQRDDSPLEDAGRLCRISPDATDKFTVKEEAFTVPNLPDHLVPEEFAGNEWFVEEQYERYQQDKNLVDPSWWPIFQSIDKALQGTPAASAPVTATQKPRRHLLLQPLQHLLLPRRLSLPHPQSRQHRPLLKPHQRQKTWNL